MAQKPMTSAKMFTANWTEKDEAVLVDLLHRKISELRWEMKEASSPYERRHLKEKRNQYKEMLVRVQNGDYDPNILRAELDSANAYRATSGARPSVTGKSKYIDTYSEIDFDYDRYFTKTRYYGTALPLISILLTLVFLFVMLSSAILPNSSYTQVETSLNGDSGPYLSLGAIGYFRLGEGALDFSIPNDGNWPNGIYSSASDVPEQGTPLLINGEYPESVYLHRDLQMVAVEVNVIDVLRALLRTPALVQYYTSIEEIDAMQGRSWYYYKYMWGDERQAAISTSKDEEGNYDAVKIVRHIATYGTIVFLVATLLCALLQLIFGIGQLFSYTSRRVHVFSVLTLLFAILTLLCPVFLEIPSLSSADVSAAFDSYFTMEWTEFALADSGAGFNVNLLLVLVLILPLINIFLPLLFKNRTPKPITAVPKGNRKHAYNPGDKRTKPGKERVEKTAKGSAEPLPRGSRKPYDANTPYRRPNER